MRAGPGESKGLLSIPPLPVVVVDDEGEQLKN